MYKRNVLELKEFSNGLAAFKNEENYCWGFIDREGNVIIKPKFTNVIGNFNNYSCIVETGDIYDLRKRLLDLSQVYVYNKEYFLINKQGRRISKYYDIIDKFKGGFSVVSNWDKKKHHYLYGLINEKGEEILSCKYKNAYKDSCEYTLVDFDNKKITIKFNNEIEKKYICKNNESLYEKLSKEYKEVIKEGEYYIVTNYALIDEYSGPQYALINENGETICPFEMNASDFKRVDKDIFLVDRYFDKILLYTNKVDLNNVSVENFTYDIDHSCSSNMFKELNNSNDFVLVNKTTKEDIISKYYLVNKENLKVKIDPFLLFYYQNGEYYLNDKAKDILKYLDLSKEENNNLKLTRKL